MLDLDALVPNKEKVKFKGKTIQVEPPSTEQIVRLMKVSSKFRGLESGDFESVEASDFDELANVLTEIIPELKEEKLNLSQVMGLVGVVMKMAMPGESEELDKKGIKVDIDPKAKAA